MPEVMINEAGIIVNTLLHIGERVVAVSRAHEIIEVWDREDAQWQTNGLEYKGRQVADARNDYFIAQCDALIDKCFETRKSDYFEYKADIGYSGQVVYAVRVLPIHPDKCSLFIVVENLSGNGNACIIEDKWKMALDAAGDGMWEINMQTDKIFLSEKWHDIFGYAANEIVSGSDWGAKIHPDDMAIAQRGREDYLGGKTKCYSAELRYLCKDGSYKWVLSRGIAISKTSDGQLLRFIGTHTDINERKNAEEKYFSLAGLLSKLINNIDSGILVTDEHRKLVYANTRFCEMYGIAGDPAQLSGGDMDKRVQDSKHFYKEPDTFVKRTEEIYRNREIVLNDEWEFTDGRVFIRDYIPLNLGTDYKDEIWQFRDVTEQKNIEKRIADLRNFYENILHNLPADIAVFNSDHTYLFVNRHAFKNEELRRYMIGKTDIDYARYSNRPDSFARQRFALYDAARDSGKRTEIIEELVNKQGEKEHHLRMLNPIYFENGSLEFLVAYGVNVTPLILAQEALKRSADTFASAFDYSGIGMALISPDGAWLDVNSVLCNMTGYTKDELMAQSYHDITYADDDEMDRPLINKMLKKEIANYTIEKRYVSKEKKIVLVLLTVSLVWHSDGKLDFFIAQVVDITEKKKLEEKIKRKNKDLEVSKTSLINKVEQLEELSHIIAHNLRGPAGNIKMLAEALLDKSKGSSGPDHVLSNAFSAEKAVEFIHESSTSLISSLATLMEITEIKLNKEIPYDHCNIEQVVNEIMLQLLSVIYEKGAEIKSDLGIEVVSYPKAYLENILYNLISNALKYSRPGVPPQIYVSSLVVDGRNKIIVKDNGLGINMLKYGNRIFKLNEVFHKGYDSKGIGLYITKTQVESLGGSIEVSSVENEGSEFVVTL